ncbi:MAG: hypothetical protein GY718_10115 [Lentisphaerae bacterium]|nr:hypothetical protein [Lentisphaerota bacterium]
MEIKKVNMLKVGDCIFDKEGLGFEIKKIIPIGKATLELTISEVTGFYGWSGLKDGLVKRFRKTRRVYADCGEYKAAMTA